MDASSGSLLREAAKGQKRERRGHHQKGRDDLRGGERASEDEPSLEIASKELDDESRERSNRRRRSRRSARRTSFAQR